MPDSDNQGLEPDKGCIAIVARSGEELGPLFKAGYSLATSRQETLYVLVPGSDGTAPDWLEIPEPHDPSTVQIDILEQSSIATDIGAWVRRHDPAVVAFAFDPSSKDDRYALSKELDATITRIRCPVALLHAGQGWESGRTERPLNVVPFTGDADSRFALKTALDLNPDARIVVLGAGPTPVDDEDRIARESEFARLVGPAAEQPQVTLKLLLGDDVTDQMLEFVNREADIILVGASGGNTLARVLLGDRAGINLSETVWRIVRDSPVSIAIFREYQGWLRSSLTLLFSQGESLLPDVSREERVEIYKEIRRSARQRVDFFVMIGMSAAIASFGLLLNSPAVIIGAMLIAPLMSAIIGMGLGIVQGDMRFLLNATSAAMRGALVATAMGVVIGALNFAREPTAEMLARSGPSLLDLAVAIVSGAAAAYALCRKGMSASLPGVAIAVALVPPLASVGLFLAMAEWGEAYGAFLLFTTNLAAIAMSSGMVFALVGFRPTRISAQDTRRVKAFRRGFLVVGLTVLLMFTQLAILSIDRVITRNMQNRLESTVEGFLENNLTRQARLFDLKYEEDEAGILDVSVIAASTRPLGDEEAEQLSGLLSRLTSQNVRVSLISSPLSTGITIRDRGD